MTETAKNAEPAPAPAIARNLWTLTVVCLLGWLIPGMGHLLIKRVKRAVTFIVIISFLFLWGLALGAKIWSYEPHQPLTFFAMVSQIGVGIPYFAARTIAGYAQNHQDSIFFDFAVRFNFGSGDITRVTFEYGNTFTWVSGLLNFLVILDAYDLAVGKKKD